MKIEFPGYEVTFDDSQEMKDKVFDCLIEWYKKHEAFHGECIQQSDRCLENAPDILAKIADDIIKFDEKWE